MKTIKKILLSFVFIFCAGVYLSAQTVTKQLYLSGPGQILDRVDPVATGGVVTSSTATLLAPGTGVLVDRVSSVTSLVSPVTVSHTTGTGSNRLMLVGISQKNRTVSSVLYGTTPLTLVGENISNNNARISIYALVNPPSVTANVTVNFSANPDRGAIVGVMTFTGVDQSTALGTFASAQANSSAQTLNVTSATGELVFDVIAKRNQTITVGTSQTQRWNISSGSDINGGASTKAGSATTIMSWTAANSDWAMGAVSIKPVQPNPTTTFTQSPALCSDLTMVPGTIVVSNYVNIISGAMPSNPNITAVLRYGATNILTLTNPVYNNGTGILTWTGALGSNVTIPAGAAISMDVTTAQGGVSFKIDFDSQTKPSKISFPVSTYINVNSVGVYSAPYSGGFLVTNSGGGTTRYIRAVVSDPFGPTDITALNFTITPTGTTVPGTFITNNGCTRIFEYVWSAPSVAGTYAINATAKEGYENTVTHSKSITHDICLVCPPAAANDSITGSGGTPITIDVLANDFDPNNNLNPSSLSVLTQPSNGSAYIVDNKVVYLPNGTFSGKDTLTYRVCDFSTPVPLCTMAYVYISIDPTVVDVCAQASKQHVYYIPYPEDDAYKALQASASSSMPSNNIRTVISMKIPYAGMTIIWDEWEDGYEVNPLNPVLATTKVWGDGNPYNGIAPGYPSDIIPAGGNIVMDNTMPANPRNSAVFFYDGKDKVIASGQIAMTQVSGEPGNIAVQVIKTNITSVYDFGQSFTIPFGENFNSQDFRYTSLFIRASQDNTVLNIDKDNNGTFETTANLNEGGVYFVNGGVLTGATVASDKPVGVEVSAGGVDGFSIRNAPIFPATWYSNIYFTPVPTSSTSTPRDTSVVMLYNSLNSSIDINWYSGAPASGIITVPAKSAIRFPLDYSATAAYKFVNLAGKSFSAIEIVDSYTPGGGGNSGSTYDWAFNLISELRLTDFATIAWAPGSLDGSRNDNPIWVTPNINTTLYVKYNGDVSNGPNTSPCGLKYDVAIALNALNYTKIKNPSINDQSGIAVYTCNGAKIAAVYGEDPSTAVAGSPSWDVGATMQPFCKQKLIIAKDDYARTLINQPVTISVLLNDVGFQAVIDPATLNTSGVLQPKHGTTSINSNGTILYTPATGYTGIDTFEYVVCSTPSPVVCAKAKVFVTISGCPADNNQNVISGQVFWDRNKDGTKNDDGAGFPNIKVYLYADGNQNAVIDANEKIDSVTVDSSGYYQFVRYPEKIIADNFETSAGASSCATGTDGNVPWTTSWTDTGDPSTGFCNTTQSAANTDVEVVKNTGFSYGLRLKDQNRAALRMINMSGVTKAFLSFSYMKKSTSIVSTDTLFVQASPNGTTFTTIYAIKGDGTVDNAYMPVLNQDISTYLSATTYIRFLTNNNMTDNDSVYIDDVTIKYLNYPQYYITGTSASSIPTDASATTVQQKNMTITGSGSCSSLADFGIAKNSIKIDGKLYNDNNALKDGLVNGYSCSDLSGAPVYVYLTDKKGKILNKATVGGTGSFNFPSADVNFNYNLVTSVNNQSLYTPVTVSGNNPPDWLFTGENYGTSNAAGSGIDPGTADGIVKVNTGLVDVDNIQIGIERLPDSDNKLYFISKPAQNSYMTLNGTGLLPGPLSGADPEDGILGPVNNLHITSLPTGNNQLYYNGIQITVGKDGTNPPSESNPFLITNYNQGLLQVKYTGLGINYTEFKYAFLDAADLRKSTSATYRIEWEVPLPVKLISFDAIQKEINRVELTWVTVSEINLSHFVVERSIDGINFSDAGMILANGSADVKTYYNLTDNISSIQSGSIYYRLRSVDIDGKYIHSDVRIIRLSKQKEGFISILTYPNPASNQIYVTIPASWQNKKVVYELINALGHLSQKKEMKNSNQTETLNISQLTPGFYIIRVSCDGETAQQKVIKN